MMVVLVVVILIHRSYGNVSSNCYVSSNGPGNSNGTGSSNGTGNS